MGYTSSEPRSDLIFRLIFYLTCVIALLFAPFAWVLQPWLGMMLACPVIVFLPWTITDRSESNYEPIKAPHGSIWPTKALHDIIEDPESPVKVSDEICWELEDAEEIHDLKLLKHYAPDIKIEGLDLVLERFSRFNTWGGVFGRALRKMPESEEDEEREICLQYLYIYTKQLGVISIVWWVALPALMAIWTFLLPWDHWSFPLIVFLPLPIVAILEYRADPTGRIRATAILLPFWLLIFFYILDSMIPVILFSFISIACFSWWMFDRFGPTPSSHLLDYIPVFIWLTKSRSWGSISKVCWDSYHYKVDCRSGVKLVELNRLDYYRTVRLVIENSWHSLGLGTIFNPWGMRWKVALGFSIFSILGTVWFYVIMYLLGPSAQYPWIPIGTVICPLLIVFLFIVVAMTPSDLVPDYDEMHLLTDSHLKALWNLRLKDKPIVSLEPEPSLIVICKMQAPFKHEKISTFRDEIPDLYNRIKELQEQLKETDDM
jgi:hypothetical protein